LAAAYYSLLAELDLLDLDEYTLDNWGAIQAERYTGAIERCCARLAENPYLGRACDQISQGLRRIEQGRYVIFYRQHENGIRVVRVLHQDMQANQHSLEDA
jgi:toxin ParE1/3/4